MTASLEVTDLLKFLAQELSDLPDKIKIGNNTKYLVKDAVMAAFSVFFTEPLFIFRTSTFDEKYAHEKIMLKAYFIFKIYPVTIKYVIY